MSFAAVAIAGGTFLGGEVVKGTGAAQNADDIAAAKKAAGEMYSTTLGQINQKTSLDIGKTLDEWRTGRDTTTTEGESATTNVYGQIENLNRKTNMTAVGEVVDMGTDLTSSITDKFQKQMQTLTNTKDYVVDSTKLAGEVSKSQAEEKYEEILANLEATPDTFWEGAFGGIFS